MEANNQDRDTMDFEHSTGSGPPGENLPGQPNANEMAEVARIPDGNQIPPSSETTSEFPALYRRRARLPSAIGIVEDIRKEAAELRNFTISYLSLLLYVNFIIASTTHEQILLLTPVTLPLLNVQLPIVSFFGFMPWVLFFFHMYVLVQHYLFSQHLFHFIRALRKETPANRDYLRRSLGNLPFLHWMAGDHHALMQLLLTVITLVLLIFWPLVTLLWLQMAFLPYHDEMMTWWQRGAVILDVLLLAWIWPMTLDWKDNGLRWWLKVFPLCGRWFASRLKISWRLIRSGDNKSRVLYLFGQGAARFLRYILPVPVFGFLLLSTVFLSVGVATIPDSIEEEWERKHLGAWFQSVDSAGMRTAFAATAWLHEQHPKRVDPASGEYGDLRSQGATDCPEPENEKDRTADAAAADRSQEGTDAAPETASAENGANTRSVCLMIQPRFPRNLIVRERVITANDPLKPDLESAFLPQNAKVEPKILTEIRGVDLADRNLQYADFHRSAFPKANLRRAKLKRADFGMSKLDQADLQGAHLIGTDLSQAKLPGANLGRAELPGADLTEAEFPGADLTEAELPGANMTRADLSGANLTRAALPAANLHRAKLSGANLTRAKLPGADLTGAELSAANLTRAELSGANLTEAQLPGTNLRWAKLYGADFQEAELPGAILVSVKYVGLAKEDAENSAAMLGSELRELPRYGGEQGRSDLNDDMEDFRRRVSEPANFSFRSAPDRFPCLRSDAPAGSEPKSCLPESIALKGSGLFLFWRKLACADTTAQRWIAQALVQRALDPREKRKEAFAQILHEAEKNGKTCPGLVDLPAELKARLNQSKASLG